MTAYSFHDRFRAPILFGTKDQTIRRERTGRSRHARPGEPVQLYTGMRTPQCAIIGIAPCVLVEPIRLCVAPGLRGRYEVETPSLCSFYAAASLDRFARRDGFDDWDDMAGFFRWMYPGVPVFAGVRVVWRPLCRIVERRAEPVLEPIHG